MGSFGDKNWKQTIFRFLFTRTSSLGIHSQVCWEQCSHGKSSSAEFPFFFTVQKRAYLMLQNLMLAKWITSNTRLGRMGEKIELHAGEILAILHQSMDPLESFAREIKI